jgi:hypothetical protein
MRDEDMLVGLQTDSEALETARYAEGVSMGSFETGAPSVSPTTRPRDTPRSPAKYGLFAVVGVMTLFVAWNNERFFLDPLAPEWSHYNPVKWQLLPMASEGRLRCCWAPCSSRHASDDDTCGSIVSPGGSTSPAHWWPPPSRSGLRSSRIHGFSFHLL